MPAEAGRVAHDQAVRWNVARHDGARADHRIGSHRDPAQQRGVGADRCATLKSGARDLGVVDLAPRAQVVRQRDIGPQKDVVFDRDPFLRDGSAFDQFRMEYRGG